MSLEGLVKQELFVLTPDMVPIHIVGLPKSVSFICPLPKGFKKIIPTYLDLIATEAGKIIQYINGKVLLQQTPFENMLLEYHNRTKTEQLSLLRGFQIIETKIDEQKGIFSVDVGKGHIYLDQMSLDNCEYITLYPLKGLFEENTAFLCHNVDHFGQALPLREFSVQYFNLLNRLIFQK